RSPAGPSATNETCAGVRALSAALATAGRVASRRTERRRFVLVMSIASLPRRGGCSFRTLAGIPALLRTRRPAQSLRFRERGGVQPGGEQEEVVELRGQTEGAGDGSGCLDPQPHRLRVDRGDATEC